MQQRNPSPCREHRPTAVHGCVPHHTKEKRKKENRQKQKEKRILSSPSVVAKGTWSASLCCDWIIIELLIRVVYVFSVDSFSERQRALWHPAGPDKSYESFPQEPQRTRRGESFSPNPGRCHCHGVLWPITHGTWTDGRVSNQLFSYVSTHHPQPQHTHIHTQSLASLLSFLSPNSQEHKKQQK